MTLRQYFQIYLYAQFLVLFFSKLFTSSKQGCQKSLPATALCGTPIQRAKKSAGTSMTEPKTLLRDIFGFDEFRPGQSEIIEA